MYTYIVYIYYIAQYRFSYEFMMLTHLNKNNNNNIPKTYRKVNYIFLAS